MYRSVAVARAHPPLPSPSRRAPFQAELKRVYTQLRMYKLKNIYQDNPHISKRKGGKKSSDKEKLKRRLSIPPASPQAKSRDLNRSVGRSVGRSGGIAS